MSCVSLLIELVLKADWWLNKIFRRYLFHLEPSALQTINTIYCPLISVVLKLSPSLWSIQYDNVKEHCKVIDSYWWLETKWVQIETLVRLYKLKWKNSCLNRPQKIPPTPTNARKNQSSAPWISDSNSLST